jgi:hypothetical protein
MSRQAGSLPPPCDFAAQGATHESHRASRDDNPEDRTTFHSPIAGYGDDSTAKNLLQERKETAIHLCRHDLGS